MQIINFLYKTRKLTSKLGCVSYQVKVFDPLNNVVIIKTFYDEDFLKGYSVDENIKQQLIGFINEMIYRDH